MSLGAKVRSFIVRKFFGICTPKTCAVTFLSSFILLCFVSFRFVLQILWSTWSLFVSQCLWCDDFGTRSLLNKWYDCVDILRTRCLHFMYANVWIVMKYIQKEKNILNWWDWKRPMLNFEYPFEQSSKRSEYKTMYISFESECCF